VIGYDSDNLDAIPDTADLVMYYDDGENGSATPAQLTRLKNAIQLSITRRLVPGYWGDIEPGCLWPISQGVQALADGLVTGLYCQLSIWSDVRDAVFAARLAAPPYWVAAYPNVTPDPPVVDPAWIALGAVMWQYVDPPRSGGHFDLSVTAPAFPIPTSSASRLNRLLLLGA
jgi:hypothetical protein